MVHTVTCAIKSSDGLIVQQFVDRLAAVGIKATDQTPSGSRYTYFDLHWDDEDTQTASRHRATHRAGAKPKKLLYDGKQATCGLVWHLRENEYLSDAAIGLVLDASESTVARRRKKHLADGDFYKDSDVIF